MPAVGKAGVVPVGYGRSEGLKAPVPRPEMAGWAAMGAVAGWGEGGRAVEEGCHRIHGEGGEPRCRAWGAGEQAGAWSQIPAGSWWEEAGGRQEVGCEVGGGRLPALACCLQGLLVALDKVLRGQACFRRKTAVPGLGLAVTALTNASVATVAGSLGGRASSSRFLPVVETLMSVAVEDSFAAGVVEDKLDEVRWHSFGLAVAVPIAVMCSEGGAPEGAAETCRGVRYPWEEGRTFFTSGVKEVSWLDFCDAHVCCTVWVWETEEKLALGKQGRGTL